MGIQIFFHYPGLTAQLEKQLPYENKEFLPGIVAVTMKYTICELHSLSWVMGGQWQWADYWLRVKCGKDPGKKSLAQVT